MTTPTYLDDVKRVNVERLISHLNGVGASIVQSYPMAEVQSWTIQRAEANAIVSAGSAATLALAPFLTLVCEAQHGTATGAARLAQVKTKAAEVKANADLWAALSAYVNGLRARTQDVIEAAETENAAHAALHAAFAELETWRTSVGI